MGHKTKIARSNLGKSPGSLIYIGKETALDTKIKCLVYNEAQYEYITIKHIDQCVLPQSGEVLWLNVDGIHDPKIIEKIGECYKIHPLMLEDVLNTDQKPKIEFFNDSLLFVTFKMMEYNNQTNEVMTEHVSLILGNGFVISFQEEGKKDIFENIYLRIQTSAGKTRKNGADYLFYSLIDLLVDNYFLVIDKLGEDIEQLESDIINRHDPKTKLTLYSIKRQLSAMRKIVLPLREILSQIIRNESDFIENNTQMYFRYVQDHIVHIIESLDAYRETMNSLLDLYLSQISNKMNNIMKVLTVISVIFIPLTFLAGIYGMNFDNMPELHWQNGYFYLLGLMGASVVLMLLYFKNKKWI